MEKKLKKSFDVTEDQYEAIMLYAYKHKLYKFSYAVSALIDIALEAVKPVTDEVKKEISK